MADGKKPVPVDAMPNDVADWGEKDRKGAYEPGRSHMIAGKACDLSKVPSVLGKKPAK